MADWYYSQGGNQQGPVPAEVLRQKLASGEVAAQDMVWREGMANWQPASNVPELSGGAGQAAPTSQFGGQPQYGVPPAPPQGGYQQPYQPSAPGYGGQPGGPIGYAAPAQDNANSKKATTAFILSLVGLVCFGVILGPLAIIMGIQAQNGMKQTGNYTNKGLAVAAVVIGIIDLVGWAFALFTRFSNM